MAKAKYPRKPKAPKATASAEVHKKFHAKVAEWKKKCSEVDRKNKAQADAAKKTAQLKSK